MKYKSTVVYFVAAFILACIYFYDVHREKKEDEAKKAEKTLLDISADQLDEIILTKGKDSIRIHKESGAGEKKWRITSPINTPADGPVIANLKAGFVKLKYQRIIDDNASNPTTYGLDRPVFSIGYKAGTKKGSLIFGSTTPLEDGHYARKESEKRVYLVDVTDKKDLDKTLFELREKKLFSLASEKISQCDIIRHETGLALRKKEGKWFLKDDRDFTVDGEKVETILRRFAWAEATSFEKETPDDPQSFGLDKPSAVVILSDGKKSEEIRFGNPSQDTSGVYASMKGKPQIMTVDNWLLSDLPQNKGDIKAAEKEKEKENNKPE